MIDYENFCKIKKLHEQDGLNVFQIAGELGLDQRTVAKLPKNDTVPKRSIAKRAFLILLRRR